ncbi:MAG: SAM-dependent chlorinase/fluorinase [Chloroflexi bacterium]|nr:SAM-dependent chlorinase/fluorinase [Chloroflexota bacterium]
MTAARARPVITFATDFGPAAPAVCRGVMYQIAPEALIIDISHQIPRFSIRDGAATLTFALPYMPVGVHVAVVDPGVGTDRLAVALQVARGDVLVGPDNGLLMPAADRLGGVVRAHVLENSKLMLPIVTSSFHGRDIFAPMAAHLAMGTPIETVGRAVDPATLVRSKIPRPRIGEGGRVPLGSSLLMEDSEGQVSLADNQGNAAERLHLAVDRSVRIRPA